MLGIQVAVVLVLLVLIVAVGAAFFRRGREGFVSDEAKAVYAGAREVFHDGDANYTAYKNRVPEADPVQYSDVRKLWKEGQLTPEKVQGVL